MKKFLFLAIAGVLFISLSSWTIMNQGATHTSYNYTEPFITTFPDPCTGELIDFTGNVHYHGTVTITPKGKAKFNSHGNLQGVSGVGQTSGTNYNYTGTFSDNFNVAAGQVHTYVTTQNVISQGSGDNWKLTVRHHHTTNANGEVTVWFDIESASCN